jgi:hypothetical protein
MNGIKMSDCRFYVDEAARTVVCVIPNTRKMVMDFIYEHFDWADISMADSMCNRMFKEIDMPYSFMGKAVCAPEDEWNEETGRMIAFARAKDKCYKSFFRRANKFVQTVDRRLGDMITTFNDFGVRLEDKREGLQQRIDELTGVTTEEEEE